MWLLALFIGVPLVEIALFIQVGGAIGLWSTLAIVVLTAVIGTSLMRRQGAQAMAQIRVAFNSLSDPSEPLAHGAMILFSGALLLTPGFFTDAVGFALLVPAFRSAAFRWLKSRVNVTTFSTGPAPGPGGPNDVIDGEFEDISPKSGQNPPSGWTRD